MSTSFETVVALPAQVDLHARPAADFVRAAMQFDCDITVAADDREADAKSLLAVLALGARGGSTLRLERHRQRRRPRARGPRRLYRLARLTTAGPTSTRAAFRPGPGSPAAAPSPRGRARRAKSSERIHCRSVPTRAAPTLSSSTPAPIRSGALIGSDAASPQTSSGTPRLWRPRPRLRLRAARAGCGPGRLRREPVGPEDGMGEVVGADAEEVDLGSDRGGGVHALGGLDHRSDLRAGSAGNRVERVRNRAPCHAHLLERSRPSAAGCEAPSLPRSRGSRAAAP